MHTFFSREPRKAFFGVALLSVFVISCWSYIALNSNTSLIPKMIQFAKMQVPRISIARLSNTSTATLTKQPDMPKLCIVYLAGNGGRLGNLMFQYASLFGIAKTNNRSAVVSTLRRYDALWDLFANLTIPRSEKRPEKRRKWSTRGYASYHQKLDNLPNVNFTLIGYFQTWKYFAKYESEIRQQFTFKDSVLLEARNYLKNISTTYKVSAGDGNVTFVGVHIRRGDRLTRKELYRVAGKAYLVKAMDAFRRNFTRVHFVVCSDDISWCRNNLRRQKNVSFSEGRSPGVDLAILSLCSHTLVTVGTFGWWAGWLAGGVTTYYSNFAPVSSSVYKGLNVADHFPPDWIPMND